MKWVFVLFFLTTLENLEKTECTRVEEIERERPAHCLKITVNRARTGRSVGEFSVCLIRFERGQTLKINGSFLKLKESATIRW